MYYTVIRAYDSWVRVATLVAPEVHSVLIDCSSHRSHSHIRASHTDMAYPKVIVFDLDYTLWPFWCDTHVNTPIRPKPDGGAVVDSYGDHFSFYKDVPEILVELSKMPDVKVCLASRTHTPRIATDLLNMLLIDNKPMSTFFDLTAWGTSSKVGHFKELQSHAKVPFEDMILFDDETRNRDVERQLGVTFVEVVGGLNKKTFKGGIERWRKKNAKRLN